MCVSRTSRYCLAFVALLSSAVVAQEAPPKTIRGVVVDTAGQPIPGVTLRQKGARQATSDDQGRFALTMQGEHKISVSLRRVGLHPAMFVAASPPDTAVSLMMYAMPQQLPAMVVLAQRRAALERYGFYERQKNFALGGYFITPEDLDKRKPRSATGAVEHVPGIKVSLGMQSDSPMIMGNENCFMNVFLNGSRLSPDSTNTIVQRKLYSKFLMPEGQKPITHPQNIQLDKLVNVQEILAVEVYPRALQAPPQYQPSRSQCGVVLVWLKGFER
jgi:hypothetical protein